MNPSLQVTAIENDDRRKSTFYISLKDDSISSARIDTKLPFIKKVQLCSSVAEFNERSMETVCIVQSERQDDSIRTARMKRYGVVLNANSNNLIDRENSTALISNIQIPIVKEKVMSDPTTSKTIFDSSKVPITLLPKFETGTVHSNSSTLSSECTPQSSGTTKKSINFIRRSSSIKLYRHNSSLKTITPKCAMSSVGVCQANVPVKALDTKQLSKFLSDRTANETILRAILSRDENEFQWKTSPNADGSYEALCLQSSALILPARDKKRECSSSLSNFFLKRSFRSTQLKRTKSVTKVYVSMCETDNLRISRSHENLLSNHVSLSSIDYPNRGTISILPVHASLLGHRHGFQIYSDSGGVKYYTCKSRQERDLWLHGLRKMLIPNNVNTLRKDNSIKIWIYEAKSLPSKKRYFCEIYLDNVLYGRTSSKLNKDILFWGECLEFLDIPKPKIIKINLYCEADKKKRRDNFSLIGSVNIRIQDVMPHVLCEDWYPILAEKKDGTRKRSSKQSQSTIRIKCRFQSLTILPINEYQEFLTYLKENYVKLCELIEPVIGVKAKEEIGQALVLVMHSQNMVPTFLADVVALDLLRVDDQRLTFRGNSLATKSMEAFLKLCGEQYLQDTLFAPIVKIIDSERDCEVDPMKTDGMLLKQQQELRSAVEMIWKAILSSIDFFPWELRVCFSTFRDRLKTLGREDISDNLISASLFLRFLCPAILSPSLFNITNEMPPALSTRNLTLVAKTLQTLANFTRFQGKEYFMEFLNSFVEEEAPRMKQFLSDISSLQVNSENKSTLDWSQHIDQGKHLAILHSLLPETLAKLSKDKCEELSPLITILEALSSATQSGKILSHSERLNKHEHSLISTNKLSTAKGFNQQMFEKKIQKQENSMLHNRMKLKLHNSYDSLHCVNPTIGKDRADNYQVQNSEILEKKHQEERQTNVNINQNKRASTLPRKINCHSANSFLKREELEHYNSNSVHTNDIITLDKHVKSGLSLDDTLSQQFSASTSLSPLNIIENKVCCTSLLNATAKSQTMEDNESNPSNMPMCLEDLQDLFNYADEQQVLENNSATWNGSNSGFKGSTAHDIYDKHGARDKAGEENVPFNNVFSECYAAQMPIPIELGLNYKQMTRNVNNVHKISTFYSSDCTINEPKFNAENNDSLTVYKDSYRRDKSNDEPANMLHSHMFNEKRKKWHFYPGVRLDKSVDINEISKNQENGGHRNFNPITRQFAGSEGINDFSMKVDNEFNCTYDAVIGTISVRNIEPSDSRSMFKQATIYSNGIRRSDIPRTNPMMQYKQDECLEVRNNSYDEQEYLRHTSHGSERSMSVCFSDTEYRYNSSLGVHQYIKCSRQSNNRSNNSKAIENNTISNHMMSNNIQSVEQCEREIQRLHAALDAMRQKLETSELKHELRTDLTNITNCNNSMVGGIIKRLLIMEEELRREQQTMYLALSQKQRVIEAQGEQIAALDAANNRLLTALSSMQKKYRTDSTHIGKNLIPHNNFSETN